MVSERLPLRLVAAVMLAGLLWAPAARAEPTAADKETARHLMKVGDEKFAARDYKAALRSYETAHAIMHVPTTGVAVAKARVKLNQLIEAREVLLEVTRSPAEPGEPAAFTEARSEAAALAKDLEGRIPSMILQIQGPPSDAAVEVTLDGQPVPMVGLSTTRKINPGAHVVTASGEGFAPGTAKVTVKERESRRVTLKLVPGEGDAGGGAPADPDAFVRYREGFHVGVSGGPMLVVPFDGGVLFGPTAGMLLNVGLTPKVDLRIGAFGSIHFGEYSFLHLGGPLSVRVNLTSRFAVGGGLAIGYGTDFGNESGFAGGPEWSLLSLRLGDRREWEVDFVQGFRFGQVPAEYHNGFTLTYLFLDGPG